MTENKRAHQATVKSYNATRGFGFVRVDEIDNDIFFHRSVMDDAGISHMQSGDHLTCEIKPVPRGYQVVAILSYDSTAAQVAESDEDYAPLIRRRPGSPVAVTAIRSRSEGEWNQRGADALAPQLLQGAIYRLGESSRSAGDLTAQPAQPAKLSAPAPRSVGLTRAPLSDKQKETLDHQGILKWFDRTKGFGFIVDDDSGRDVFMHVTALTRSGFAAEDIPEPGTELAFSIKPAPQGIQVDCFAYL